MCPLPLLESLMDAKECKEVLCADGNNFNACGPYKGM